MIPTMIEELNFILDGGFKVGDSIFLKFPENKYNGYISFPMMGKESFNVLILFRESWYNLEQKLIRLKVPYKVDLVIDAYSRANNINYSDNKVIFIDSPSLLNDISYEYNTVIQNIEKPIFLNILTSDAGLERNEINSFSKFIEVMQSRTIVKGVFMLCGVSDVMKNKDFYIEIEIQEQEEILKSKQFISEVFFKIEPFYNIL